MGKHQKTISILEATREILSEYRPMTVRQIYYQLVSRQVIENNKSNYQAVSKALVDARKEEIIPWGWIEDRLRQPREVSMWNGLSDFSEAVKQSYRKNVWDTQSKYIEVWEEKDSLSGIFEDILEPYGITLNVGRGYDGWSSIRSAGMRYLSKDTTILYFGDFDPSGEDMVRSLEERLFSFGCKPEIIKCALNWEDIETYHLPQNYTKPKDTRSKAFIEKYGNISVELDALPTTVLQTRLKKEIESRMDMDALNSIKIQEDNEIEQLVAVMQEIR